jgi:hypothetical protein
VTKPRGRERLGALVDQFRTLDGRTAVVLISAALALTYLEFGPTHRAFDDPSNRQAFADGSYGPSLDALTRWSIGCFLAYLVAPALIVKLVLRERLLDYGLSLRSFLRHLPIYGLLYLLVLPFVLIVPALFFPEVLKVYPFYRGAGESPGAFVRWQLVYGLQFLSLEFFFRASSCSGSSAASA